MSELVTQRLRLRMWLEEDIEAWAALCAEPSFWRYPYGHGFDPDRSAEFLTAFIRHWDEHGFGLWAAADRNDGTLIGFIGLAVPTFLPEVLPAVEIGWRLGRAWWKRGLAIEGARAALAYGFRTLSQERIISIAEPENVASLSVSERLGMEVERETIHPTLGVALIVMSITRRRWELENV